MPTRVWGNEREADKMGEELVLKERGKVEFHAWIKEVGEMFGRPKGPIAVTSSHVPASLDLSAIYGIRKILGWGNRVRVILLDNVPPRVDARAGFHGIHGYKGSELYQHPPPSFWEKSKPYFTLDRRFRTEHIHKELGTGNDIVDFHEGLRRILYGKMGLKGIEIVRASYYLPHLFREIAGRYGPKTMQEVLRWLLGQKYVLGGSVVRGNAARFIWGSSSAREKKGRRLLLRIAESGDQNALDQLQEMVERREVLPKGELSLALLLLNGENHWGNNYLKDPYSVNLLMSEYGGGLQLTARFRDAFSPVRLYLPGGDKTTAISSVVNVLLHLGKDPYAYIRELLRRGETVSLLVPPKKV